MSRWTDIPWDQVQRLFSVVICIDKAMRVVFASDTVLRYLPDLANKPLLEEAFTILRPGKLQTFSDAIAAQESLCLLTATNRKFAIRGQLILSSYDNNEVICLYGAPWLFWMSTNCPDVRMRLNDFSPQDVQLDQLFFMTTEKRMVADLESLNVELTAAKNQLQEVHDSQHRFFAQMSHEMRTPLNGVVSALSLLVPNDLDDRQCQLITLAQSSSRNLMDVINYVLDLSKLELAREDGEAVFDLPKLIHSTIDIIAARAREKSLELKVELEPDIPQHCKGNAPRLRQVLLNLIMNAIKFTEKGSVNVRASKVGTESLDCILKFNVIDTGVGIASNIQERIFEPFWSQKPDGMECLEAGTGLGLDIVRRNVEHAGGEFGLISEPGTGSNFWFDWPVATEPVATVGSPTTDASAVIDKNVELSGRILLVDDNDTNLLLGTMIVESLGVEFGTAKNGAEAVAAALQESYDLVLMDIHMPDFDGIEATRRIRQIKDKQDLPIVALTALAYDKEKETCMASGMNGYLTKPIVKQELAQELGKWLNGNAQNSLPAAVQGHDKDPGESLAFTELLDQAVLEELSTQIGSENLKMVMKKVLSETTERWEDLIGAQNNDDKVAMQRHVHSLSSIFRSVGLMHAGDALASIEVQLRAGAKLDVGWIEELEKAKTDSLKVLKQRLSVQ